MSDHGDLAAGSVLDLTFTTLASGIPATLTGGAVSVYQGNSLVQTTVGVTLTTDFDGVVGLNQVRVNLAADLAFYVAGKDYSVIVTAGTAGGFSAVGAVAGTFSIASRYSTPAPTAAAVADAVWDEASVDHVAAGSMGLLQSRLDAAISSVGTAVAAVATAVAAVPAAVWAVGSRTLTSFGTLTTDVATAVWSAVSRTLTAGGLTAAEVWAYAVRTITSVVSGVTLIAPVNEDGDELTLVRGDDYLAADGRSLQFTSSSWPDLTDATEIMLTIRKNPLSGSDPVLFALEDTLALRVTGSGSQTVVFEPTNPLTGALIPGRTPNGKFDVQATLESGSIVTLRVGVVTTIEDQTRAE